MLTIISTVALLVIALALLPLALKSTVDILPALMIGIYWILIATIGVFLLTVAFYVFMEFATQLFNHPYDTMIGAAILIGLGLYNGIFYYVFWPKFKVRLDPNWRETKHWFMMWANFVYLPLIGSIYAFHMGDGEAVALFGMFPIIMFFLTAWSYLYFRVREWKQKR